MNVPFPPEAVSTTFLDRMVRKDLLSHPVPWGHGAFNDRTYRCVWLKGKGGAPAYKAAMERFLTEEYPVFNGDAPTLYSRGNALCVAVPEGLYQHIHDDAVLFQCMQNAHMR